MLSAEEFRCTARGLNFLLTDARSLAHELHHQGLRSCGCCHGDQFKFYRIKGHSYTVVAKLTKCWHVACGRNADFIVLDVTQPRLIRPLFDWFTNKPHSAPSERSVAMTIRRRFTFSNVKDLESTRDMFRVYVSSQSNFIITVGPNRRPVEGYETLPDFPKVKRTSTVSFTTETLRMADNLGAYWPAAAAFHPASENEACLAMVRSRQRCAHLLSSGVKGQLVLYDVTLNEVIESYEGDYFSGSNLCFMLNGRQLFAVTAPRVSRSGNFMGQSTIVFQTEGLRPILKIPMDTLNQIYSIRPLYSLCGSWLAVLARTKLCLECKENGHNSHKPDDSPFKHSMDSLMKQFKKVKLRHQLSTEEGETKRPDAFPLCVQVQLYQVPLENPLLSLLHLSSIALLQNYPTKLLNRLRIPSDLRNYLSVLKQY